MANDKRPVGQAVKTSASHAENMGSIPVRVTKKDRHSIVGAYLFLCFAQNRAQRIARSAAARVRISRTREILR